MLFSLRKYNTIKVFGLFDIEHSWELMQSIDLGSIIWTVTFFHVKMCAILQNGDLVFLMMKSNQWIQIERMHLSAYPIMCSCVVAELLAVVVNRNCLVLLDEGSNIVSEVILISTIIKNQNIIQAVRLIRSPVISVNANYNAFRVAAPVKIFTRMATAAPVKIFTRMANMIKRYLNHQYLEYKVKTN